MGLSYTTFRYSDLRISPQGRHGSLTATVQVTNAGQGASDEVVQLYTRQRTSRDKQPNQQLRAFQRVSLKPGETRMVRLTVPDLRYWHVTRGKWVLESSVHDVLVGASASDVRQHSSVRVPGEQIPLRNLGQDTRAIDFDDYAGVDLVDESKACGEAVEVGSGDWLRFSDVELGCGVRTFSAKTAAPQQDQSVWRSVWTIR